MSCFIGIDPGKSGGYSIITPDRSGYRVEAFDRTTPHDIIGVLRLFTFEKAYIEQVHSMPLQGVKSVFTFGENYGWWQGVLVALGIPFDRVTPQKWQTAMQCLTKGNKNVSKARAQELFPALKVTHATADALLIGEYGRRLSTGQLKLGGDL